VKAQNKTSACRRAGHEKAAARQSV
jgi:hypothetical protein